MTGKVSYNLEFDSLYSCPAINVHTPFNAKDRTVCHLWNILMDALLTQDACLPIFIGVLSHF